MKFETEFKSSDFIGVDEVGKGVREITFLALLREGGALKNIPQNVIDNTKNLAVIWEYDGDDIEVDHVYNTDTGEVFWDYDYACADWTDGDELILCSLIMWGELESVLN